MQHLDRQVIEQALTWCQEGKTVWLCTVLATFGSSPRAPGSWMAVDQAGKHIGSLSGGCVEEDFIQRLREGEFDRTITITRYGDSEDAQSAHITLPCGGLLDILIERLPSTSDTREHLTTLLATLDGHYQLIRNVDVSTGTHGFSEDASLGPRVVQQKAQGHDQPTMIQMRIAPARRLIIAGISAISAPCAAFAVTLGFEVIVCDPDEAACADFSVPGVEVKALLPSRYIASGVCHSATAVVALTHDPRIDDLAMIEAVRTPAFYIGVMGSRRTSTARAERLIRSGGLTEAQIDRLHMPIGLALGSKTPAEIALAVMADIVRVQHGKTISELSQ
ncbi:XdhC family protein [Vreelandella maris]|uniref:XdhC family protein n=1 Tax=Vreelandella maris TaxID=2729617 RepID=A0A7Y6RBQ7_9GAMM|nr:XdhC family protein [Halomonas maris]NVF14014.1 XdhC family protein [Halomonas maris]|tara:strand:+ start:2311 stop:3312 length:1002 start_codon:yes stop_codon:yes gene_type:complete